MIIRGANVTENVTLSASRELLFTVQEEKFSVLIDEACQQAFQKGEKQGETIGYEKALTEVKSLLIVLQTLSRKMMEYKEILLEQLKPEVVELAISVCERIIRKELSQPEVLVKLINSLISHAASTMRSEAIQLILSSTDLVMLENHLSNIHYDKREIEGVTFRSDPHMQRGDCRLETTGSLLNYTLSRQLSDLQSKVLHG